MSFQTPNSNKILENGNNSIRQTTSQTPAKEELFEPSPTIEHLRTKTFKTPYADKNNSMGQRNILNDLENKMIRRGNELYHPILARSSRSNNSRHFKDSIKGRKNDKVIYNREFMNHKNSKEENERIMNEIARNMSLSPDDYDTLELSIDAILGFSDEIYDPKSRPKHFDMVDDHTDNDEDIMEDTEDERYCSPGPAKSEELIQYELEEYLRLQEEELEYLTSNLSLG